MDSYKKRMLYIWLVPLLGLTSLISFVVWYIIIGHESFFGFFPTPEKPSFSNDMLYGGLALMYIIPALLFASWFGEGIVNAFKKLFRKRKEYEEPSNFDLLETSWHKAIVLLTITVGLYALPALIVIGLYLGAIFLGFTGGFSSNTTSGSNTNSSDYGSYSDPSPATTKHPNAEFEEMYQYTFGILNEMKNRKIELSVFQKDSLNKIMTSLSPYSTEYEIHVAIDTIKGIAGEFYIDKNSYSLDRGEIYISSYLGSDDKNKAEFINGIKKDIRRIVKK